MSPLYKKLNGMEVWRRCEKMSMARAENKRSGRVVDGAWVYRSVLHIATARGQTGRFAMIMGVGSIAWILIGLFLWEAGWKGRAIILSLVIPSTFIHLFGAEETEPLFWALGFALRVAVAVVYLIRRKIPVVS